MGKDPQKAGYTPELVTQKIKNANQFEPGLDLDPKYVKNAYTNNFIQRVMARIVGQGPFGPVVAKCTADGSLAVVSRGGAFDDYERADHTFTVLTSGTADGTTANKLVNAGGLFITNGVAIGDTVKNTTDSTYALVTAIDSEDQLSIDADFFVSGETYSIIPFKLFTLTRQVTRIDIFTYNGNVDYQISRDQVKAVGARIPLFADSFYSLDFYTQVVKATCLTYATGTPTRASLFGWFREVD